MPELVNAVNQGGISVLLFVVLIFLWAEFVRSRKICERQLESHQRQIIINIKDIAQLKSDLAIEKAKRDVISK
jgi:hypothetical protein